MKRSLAAVAVLLIAVGVAAGAAVDDIVINEILCNPAGTYDGAEYIELFNKSTTTTHDIGGWVLAGPEFGVGDPPVPACPGEDRWQFPTGTTIGPQGYILVVKDVADGDGYYDLFPAPPNADPDFEMFDPSFTHDSDDAGIPNMILLDNDPVTYYSDEIGLWAGGTPYDDTGYGVKCGTYTESDQLCLFTTASLGTIVDVIEWMNPALCTGDPCSGIDGADDNAWQGIPPQGNSLGRNSHSVDTDNSDDDFRLQDPSPKSANTANLPPDIYNGRYSPIPPVSTSPTELSAIIKDESGLDSTVVYYSVNGGPWGTVPMTVQPPGDTLYAGNIGAQATDSQVSYFIRAVDDSGAVTNYPAEALSDPFAYSVGIQTIYSIQNVPTGGDASTKVGQSKNIRGIVTAAKGLFGDSSFYIHEGNTAFKGIKVYCGGYEGEINEGDDVTVCGIVSEYFTETELYRHFPEAIVVNSTGNSNYGYADVSCLQIWDGNDDSEQWESQLVSVDLVTVTDDSLGYGEWTIDDGSLAIGDSTRVDDYTYYTYYPETGDALAEIRGILQHRNYHFKLEPRYDDDIVGPPRMQLVRYSPIPPVAGNVDVSVQCFDNGAPPISAVTLYWSTSSSGPFTPQAMSSSKADWTTYTATLNGLTDGQRIYYYTECTDGTTTKRKPTGGAYSFYVGMLDIYDIQYVAAPGTEDDSPLRGLAANISGTVTAAPGDYSDYYFVIQDAAGPWNGVKIYNSTGDLTFARGDEIICCGTVYENYSETELSLHFSEAAILDPAAKRLPTPQPVSVNTGDLMDASTAEQYEGVLVHAEDCTVADPDIGFGEWRITNQTSADTCRVNDDAYYTYTPVLNDNVWVLGTVSYAFGNYKIEPRGDEDILANPGTGIDDGQVATKFDLLQNSPNPFNPKTSIAFTLPSERDVSLEVYDVSGRKVATLLKGTLPQGRHLVEWNGTRENGQRVASGVYFYRLIADDEEINRKMVMLK